MGPSVSRIATRYFWKAASYPGSINDFIEGKWLPSIGDQIVRKIGGRYIVNFSRGYALKVWLVRTPQVEYLGLRFNTYKGELTLHYVDPEGKTDILDSMDLGGVGKLPPKKIAEWAIKLMPPPPPEPDDPNQGKLWP